jgi:putative transposase
MPRGLKRYYGKGDLHFVTFSCYRRLPFLGTKKARDVFVKELARVRAEYRFLLIGYVVMPNHVHLLMSEPPKEAPSKVLQLLKQRVSRKMRKRKKTMTAGQLEFRFEKSSEEVRSFWQARFHDFNVYKSGKVKEKLNYMHANPVIRKLVKHPKEWPWSNWRHYMTGEKGLVEIDSWGF